MRITEALKPVTDMLAAVGMSLDTATYKDGKLHVTLNTEAPKVTGKPGSGPEHPPEGWQVLASACSLDPLVGADLRPMANHKVFLRGFGWRPCDERLYILDAFKGAEVLAIAVPIAPKPEPVHLTDQEKIVGWRGPSGFRLQTFQLRECTCVVCKKTIKAGGRLARWRHSFPEGMDTDHPCGKPGSEENHSHAHVDCLYQVSIGLRGAGGVHNSLDYYTGDVPRWLQEKRQKYNAQQSTP